MRKFIVAGLSLLALSTALADTRVPGTRVSYTLKRDAVTGANASMIFVDAYNDPTGKTYLAFVCDNGEPFARLYSRVTLGAAGDDPATYFSADRGAVRTVYGVVREDMQTGKPTVLDTTSASTAQLLRVFMTASTVSVRIERQGYSALTLTFPTTGFVRAWKAIENCD